MASVKSTITEEFLTCSSCFKIYKDPKTLPCLHSFCKNCVNNFTQERTGACSYPCPICKESFQLPKDGADGLKTNFCLKNLIDFVNSTKEVRKLCSFCLLKGENIDATSLCLTCKDLLCLECADHRHRSTTLTFHHRVVPLSEVTTGKYDDEIRSKQQIPCSQHKGEDLRFFCETCDVTVCRDCIFIAHQNHRCIDSSEARKKMEDNMTSLLNSLRQKIQTYQNAEEKAVNSLTKIENEKKEINEGLEKQINGIIQSMVNSKKRIEEELYEFVKSRENILHLQEECIESERKLLDETYSFCSNILRCGSDIEILSMKKEIKERLSKLQTENNTEKCNVIEIDLPDIKFCDKINCFQMVKKSSDKETNTPRDERIAFINKELKRDENDKTATQVFQKKPGTISVKDEEKEPTTPHYSSATWMDDNTVAVIDQGNQSLKLISREHNVIKSVATSNCTEVSSFKKGIACKSGDILHIFNSSLELQKSFSAVTTLLTCHPQSTEVCWMTGLNKICILKDNDVKEIAIHEPNRQSHFRNPKFGHVLINSMFAVSDWDEKCVFLIGKSGRIGSRKYIDSNPRPGSISSDSSYNLYVCDIQNDSILIFSLGGATLRSVKIGAIAPNPKSIAIMHDKLALITNGRSIIEVDLNKFC